MTPSTWVLEKSCAALQLASLRATTDVSSLAAGLSQLRVDGTPLKGSLWKIGVGTPKVAEAFLRGNDLVAKYQELEGCPNRSSVYWTATPAAASGSIMAQLALTISLETDSLDSHPEVNVTTQLPVEEMFCLQCREGEAPNVQEVEQDVPMGSKFSDEASSKLVIYRIACENVSLAEMVHPDDFCQLEVNRPKSGLANVEWSLFGQFLEKGVIRRARMQAVVLPRENDIDTAANAFDQFAKSEACLTA